MVDDPVKLGATYRDKRYLMPYNWGTEAITVDSSTFDLADEDVSFGSLWSLDAKSLAAFR